MARRKWSAEEKQKIVLAGLKNETSVAELCRRYGVSPRQITRGGNLRLTDGRQTNERWLHKQGILRYGLRQPKRLQDIL